MLNFEYQAIEKAAKNHPATLALSLATEHAPARAIIALISQTNHDAEALWTAHFWSIYILFPLWYLFFAYIYFRQAGGKLKMQKAKFKESKN